MKAIKRAYAKETELPSVGLQTSLILSCFVFTLSYGAGSYSITDSKCSIFSTKFTQEWGLSPTLCQASYGIPLWDLLQSETGFSRVRLKYYRGPHLGELLGPRDKILGSSLPQCLRMLATAALLKVGVIFICSIRFDIACKCQPIVCLDTSPLSGLSRPAYSCWPSPHAPASLNSPLSCSFLCSQIPPGNKKPQPH